VNILEDEMMRNIKRAQHIRIAGSNLGADIRTGPGVFSTYKIGPGPTSFFFVAPAGSGLLLNEKNYKKSLGNLGNASADESSTWKKF